MRIRQVFTLFIIFWQDQPNAYAVIEQMLPMEYLNIETRECKDLKDTSLLRLKRHLLCNYDNSVYPYFKTGATINVTLLLIPKLIDFNGNTLSLDCWTLLMWQDHHLTWTPSDYDDITSIHIKSWKIWTPDLWVYNPADMSDHQYELHLKKCLLYNTGFIRCISPMKINSKCNPDYTYWPYDKQQCRITFSSWIYLGSEVDFQKYEYEVSMDKLSKKWDFKFINITKEYKMHACCQDEIFSYIEYNFLLTRNHIMKYTFLIIPALTLTLLTITVLCLDTKSIERMALASINFICHLLCLYDLHWRIPLNGIHTPNIMLFYCDSLALATFAIILTALLRKLEDINTDMPNWISFTTTFILNNKTGRFLILKDSETKVASEDIATGESSNVLKPEARMKELSWKHFVTIVDWLSFFCVILTYVIIFITLVPAITFYESSLAIASFTRILTSILRQL